MWAVRVRLPCTRKPCGISHVTIWIHLSGRYRSWVVMDLLAILSWVVLTHWLGYQIIMWLTCHGWVSKCKWALPQWGIPRASRTIASSQRKLQKWALRLMKTSKNKKATITLHMTYACTVIIWRNKKYSDEIKLLQNYIWLKVYKMPSSIISNTYRYTINNSWMTYKDLRRAPSTYLVQDTCRC